MSKSATLEVDQVKENTITREYLDILPAIADVFHGRVQLVGWLQPMCAQAHVGINQQQLSQENKIVTRGRCGKGTMGVVGQKEKAATAPCRSNRIDG